MVAIAFIEYLFDRKMSVAREDLNDHEPSRGEPVTTCKKLGVDLVRFDVQRRVCPPVHVKYAKSGCVGSLDKVPTHLLK